MQVLNPKEEKQVVICPKCASKNIESTKPNPLESDNGLPIKYICSKCGYCGYSFPEVSSSYLIRLKTERQINGLGNIDVNKKSEVTDIYGNFAVRSLWKNIAIVLLIVGLFSVFLIGIVKIVGLIIGLIGLVMFIVSYFEKKRIYSSI